MVYLKDFRFVGVDAEIGFLKSQVKTCYDTFYPFNLFPDKGMCQMDFSPVTIIYGSNGSGKSTALNVIAARIGLLRDLSYVPTDQFGAYVKMTDFNCDTHENDKGIPPGSRLVASEDVFGRTLMLRQTNEEINLRRGSATREWIKLRQGEKVRYNSADEDGMKALRRQQSACRNTLSSWIRQEVGMNRWTGSNGENAFMNFTEKIKPGRLYLLDEPEDSLAACWQRELADYIYGLARFDGCQFLIATHSPFLLGIKGAKIYNLDVTGVPVQKWTELENVREYYDFFRAHETEFGEE